MAISQKFIFPPPPSYQYKEHICHTDHCHICHRDHCHCHCHEPTLTDNHMSCSHKSTLTPSDNPHTHCVRMSCAHMRQHNYPPPSSSTACHQHNNAHQHNNNNNTHTHNTHTHTHIHTA
eukprot:GHVR01067858.1.p1 GENE.GHVR01067858.1~~GHVR01067858.1.p1  ORF type:complete len:119 (+),score=42.60 GHVR01067858.1:38-394(+)